MNFARSIAVALTLALTLATNARAQILGGSSSSTSELDPVQIQISQAVSSDKRINVVPFEFDPNDLNLAQSSWLTGVGCAPLGGTDPGCAAGDQQDKRNEGLLLAKTGSTGNVVSAGARVNGVKGLILTELGYDLRKPTDTLNPRGSHCGGGSPRFNVVIEGENFFVGCNQMTFTMLGVGWIRLRAAGGVPLVLTAFGPRGFENIAGRRVDDIFILFDEGQDTGPDNFGAAILDNITVNTQVAGRGPHGGR